MEKIDLVVENKGRLASVFITLIIITALIFSGPAGAIRVGVDIDKTEFKSSDEFVNFTVWVDIESAERIPIENLTLNITGVTNESCKFYSNGTAISGCDNVTITPINNVGYGNGTRYGYDRNAGYGYSFGNGYGYGYVSGYGYDQTDGAELSYNISWNLTKAKVLNGAYNATLYADSSGGGTDHTFSSNEATQFTVDRSPVISSISVTNIKHNAATINWNTDVNSTGKIEYGTTTSYGSEVTLSNSVKVHHRRITGLSASTIYHYRIYAYDSAGNTNVTSDKTFTTSESPGQSGSAGGRGSAPSTGNAVQTDSTGKVTATATIQSSDGIGKAIIKEGTTALDGDGKPLKSISMSSTIIGGTVAAYNLGPSGATFNPPITLSFTFNPKDVPKGEAILIKMFDGTNWISLKTTVTGNTATAETSHFTIFALFTVEEESGVDRPMVIPTPIPTSRPTTPIPTAITPTSEPTPWILVSVIVLIIVGLVVATYVVYNREYRR